MNFQQSLRTHFFFKGFSSEEVAWIEPLCKRKEFAAAHPFFKEGEEAAKLYLLERGLVRISKNGKEIGSVRPGEIFGEMPLLDGGKRSATATALEAGSLMEIPYTRLMETLLNHPETALKFYSSAAKYVSRRLRGMLERQD